MNSGSPLFICNVNSHFAEQWRRGNEAKEEVGEGRLTYWRCWRCWWLSAAVLWRQMVFPTIERETRERGYCYSLLPCFPSFSSVVFFFLSCSSLFVCLPSVSTFFPSLLSLLFPSLSFLFFPLFFRQLKSSPLCSSPLFSFLVCFCFSKQSPFSVFSSLSSPIISSKFSPLFLFFQNLPPLFPSLYWHL